MRTTSAHERGGVPSQHSAAGAADDAVNYGGMGSMIGHEIGHGFDDEGRQFDAKGNLSGWWDSSDAREFKRRAEGLQRQASQFVAVDTLHANGKVTLGENIADLGGVLTAYGAYRRSLAGKPEPARPGEISMYFKGGWHTLRPRVPPDESNPIASLDVSLLQDRVLGPVLGIGDPRTDKRIDFVGGIRGTEELERRVRSGEMAVAFSLFPTSIDQLMAVSDAGLVMPPKSTWFEPKLRSGLFVHAF